jgi:hypothetical protein
MTKTKTKKVCRVSSSPKRSGEEALSREGLFLIKMQADQHGYFRASYPNSKKNLKLTNPHS